MTKRDPDRSTGPDEAGKAAGPTAGHAVHNEDAALGLAGAPERDDERAMREEGEAGLELGAQSLGSQSNAARRVEAFNVPGQGKDA
ncbi:hypothetical protein [Roseisolibacter sp. H3M3-2]|uniref:hypothetical protein n=1 Tax=Roseisolibacter sp. H3M3-2 TaxID=3031323 RepID=UPI0023DA5D51|nr:hypothetical protein [Roseisolibacter sp. H3M3-2]MDF1504915.1 hypothetical protein [Roseisolibacter sp. H3M3-2]